MAQWENCYEEWLTEKGLSAVLDKMKECNLTFSDIELAWQLVESGKEIDEVVWQPLSEEEARNAWASRVLSVVYSEFNATTPCEPEIFVLYYEFFGLCESPDAYETTYTVESSNILFESIHKNGYRFVGWYDNAEFKGEPVTVISAGSHGNVELYAKWEQVTFNFVYELDGGVNDAANPLTFAIDTFIDDIANLRSSSKDYYNFKSWTCGPEDSAVEAWEADGNASLCTYSDNYCLIAKYTPIDYSITFNLGGGNLAETPVSKYNIETEDITLPIPSRTGYTFVGWFDNDQLSGGAIDCIPLGSHDDKVFYAKWQTIDYAITYDLNDANSVSPATNSPSNPATYTIEDTVVFADPTRVGYKFTGWSISNIDVGTYGEKTITANWQIINYDITYDLNDSNSVSLATNNGTNPSTYTIEENLTFAAPTRAGYEFTGWTLPSIAQGLTGAVSTTATWDVVNYSITYDFAIAESSKSQVVDNSANTVFSYTIEDEVSFNAPTRAGYTFASWDVPAIAKGTYGNKTIVASWNIVDYSITYNLNGGTNHSENPLSFNVEQLPITLKDADSEDDVFNSWRSTNSIDGDKITQITTIGDKTVYALFGGTEGLQYSLSSDGTYYSVSGYTGTLTDVVIGKRYNNKPVTAISKDAFENNTNIISIKLSSTITSIGGYAFRNCTGLTSVTIGNSVTSIGGYAFYECYKLVEVYNKSTLSITAGSSDNEYVAYYAKNVYTEEGSSNLSTDENGYVIYAEGDQKILVAYTGTETELVLPSYITEIYGYAFYKCSSLTSITIPSSVTNIGDSAFYGCKGLTSITIPNSVTSISDSAFRGCTGLTTVNWNATACKSAGSLSYSIFDGCSKLATVNIGDNVKIIPSYAFEDCTGLTSVTIGNGVTSIGDSAFYRCYKLVEVYNKSSLSITAGSSSNGYVAYYAKNVYSNEGGSKLTTDENGYVIYTDGDEKILVAYTGTNTELVLPSYITKINQYAFYGCTGLTSVSIGNSVTSIGNSAFSGCNKLQDIYITDIAAWCNISGLYNLMYYSSSNKKLYINNELVTILIIPDSVTSIGNYAFYHCNNLTSITIPDSVTSIGNHAFFDCCGLTAVTIPNSVTSIGDDAFYGCTGLTSVTIPDSVTSIGDEAFYGCRGLTTVNWNATACKSAGSLNHSIFGGCSKLATVNIGDSVKIIPSYAVYGCKGLTSVTIPNSVTSIGDYAFYNCTGLTSVTIGNSVTSIGDYAFYGCTGLTSIIVDEGNTKYHSAGNCLIETATKTLILGCNTSVIPADGSVTSIGSSAFSGCSGLTSITIPDSVTSIGGSAFDETAWYNNQPDGLVYAGKVAYKYKGTMPSNTSIVIKEGTLGIADSAFFGCRGLTSITIPNSVTSIGSSAFRNCIGITSITIPNSVTSIGSSVFSGCSSLESITIPFVGAKAGVTSSDTYQYPFGYIFGTLSYTGGVATWQYYYGYSTSSTASISYYIPSSLKSVTVTGGNILYGAFYNCTGLKSVTIGDGVTSIGYRSFYNCSGLTSVTIPDSVTSIGDYAFYNCKWLTSVTIGNSVTSIGGYAFCGCTGLTTVNWNATECTSAGSNRYPIFDGCSNIATVNIGNNVTTIPSYAFYRCTGLTSVTIGNSVASIGLAAFYNCYRLIEVYNKSTLSITAGSSSNGDVAYYAKNVYTTEGGSKLSTDENGYVIYTEGDQKILVAYTCTETDLVLPAYITQINQYAFYNCSGLTSITIPNSVTSIGYQAFYYCSGLTSVTIGNSVTSIGGDAFFGCSGLTSITIGNSVTSIGSEAFRNCSGLKKVFYAGTKEQWQAISIGYNNGYLTGATRVYNYDGVERTYSFVTNCEQSIDPVTAKYLSSLPTLTRDGYHFCGWYDNEVFEGKAVSAPYCSKDKTTLYAKWLTEEEWDALPPDGTSFEKAYIAESGQTYDVTITTGGQIVYFAFTPTTTGSFTIQSTGSGDTYGTLYSSTKSSLTTNDDGGDGSNFKITYTMTAGTTYYVAVKFYGSSTTGTFKVSFS